MNNTFSFFWKKKDGVELSNFYPSLVKIKDDVVIREYNSGESAFHGMKYIEISKQIHCINRKTELFNYGMKFEVNGEYGKLSGADVKKKGGKKGLLLKENELNVWKDRGEEIQRKICNYKYQHLKEVRECLEKNKDKILIHPIMRINNDKLKFCVWEGRGVIENGEFKVLGKNLLGNIWMQIRDENIIKSHLLYEIVT